MSLLDWARTLLPEANEVGHNVQDGGLTRITDPKSDWAYYQAMRIEIISTLITKGDARECSPPELGQVEAIRKRNDQMNQSS